MYKTYHILAPTVEYLSQRWFYYFINPANTIKMDMTSRAAQYCLMGRFWPVGRKLESPGIGFQIAE